MKDYKVARNSTDAIKSREEKTAQQAIQSAQNSIAEVENALKTKREEQKNEPKTENGNLKTQYLTEEKTNKQYLLIGPENLDENTEYPVMVFIPGEAQRGGGESGLYQYTTPAGVMKNWNLENFNGYVIIPTQTSNMKNWYNDSATATVKNILDDLNSKQKTGKTVIVGASSGAPGAGYMASKLGNDYFDEVVCIAGYPYGNIKTDMPISYYFGSEDSRRNNIITHVNSSNLKGDMFKIKGAGHDDIVKALLTADTDNDRKSDFLQKLFGKNNIKNRYLYTILQKIY